MCTPQNVPTAQIHSNSFCLGLFCGLGFFGFAFFFLSSSLCWKKDYLEHYLEQVLISTLKKFTSAWFFSICFYSFSTAWEILLEK